ncbi:MAG: 16S rRNA (cytosine(967)-C(5))-methyltransferase RsmB [Kangiellaceae bacterium]|nr:16S rRNA (cytosine(967)-C(5))-methyltransferase RsmB [Kangiellaceae bacterium]
MTRKVNKDWASGLVNAVLRNYQRQKNEIDKKLTKAKTYRYSHPNWIINQLESDWLTKAAFILDANNQRAPMTLRVNQQKISLEKYQPKLADDGLLAATHLLASDALVLDASCDVYKLPGFEQGLVTVQDAAAQLVVDLMDLQDGQKVLDGCAAPGGKTTHILQRAKNINLTSVEMSNNRMVKIEQTLQRLGMQSNLCCADILDLNSWWDGELFDRILIDVPCSASGVIRRNPDIKIHRKKRDLANLVSLQAEILNTCWGLLKSDGRLVYATCSVFKAENEHQIQGFLSHHAAELVEFPKTIQATQIKKELHSNASSVGYQIFPGDADMDGFYLCGLQKK